MITVRRLDEDEWERLRDIRLSALTTQDPEAFGSSIQRELAFKESHWRMRLRSSPWFLASGSHDVGVACAIHEPGAASDDRHIVSVWVQPDARRNGVARALMAAVEDWARVDGARTLSLWLVDGNDAGDALYRACGFTPTGDSTPVPRDPSVTERRWERRLAATTEEGITMPVPTAD